MAADTQQINVRKAQLLIPIQFLRKSLSYRKDSVETPCKWTAYSSNSGSDSQPLSINVETSKINDHLKLTFAQLSFALIIDDSHSIELEKISLEKSDFDFYPNGKQSQTDICLSDLDPKLGQNVLDNARETKATNQDIPLNPVATVKRKRGRPRKVDVEHKEACVKKRSVSVDAKGDCSVDIGAGSESLPSMKIAQHKAEPRKYGLRGVKLNSDIMAAEKGYDLEGKCIASKVKECVTDESKTTDSCMTDIVRNESVNVDSVSGQDLGSTMTCVDVTDVCDDDDAITVLKMTTDTMLNPKSNAADGQSGEQKSVKRPHNKIFLGNIPTFQRRKKRSRPIFCKLCDKKLSDFTGVYEHVKKHHKFDENVNQYLSKLEKLKREQCGVCGAIFADRCKLQQHEDKEHIKNVAVDCYLCGKTFKNTQSLRNHVRWMHIQAGIRHGLCHLCPATFKSTTTLKKHIDEIHHGNKYFQCDICKKKFYNKSQLKRHSRVHGLDESKRRYCTHCSKSFLFEFNLKRHIEAVHTPQSERYHCSYCGKGFGQKTGMIAHVQLVHFNLFPFSCKECKSTFARSTSLIEHMMVVHKQSGFQITERTPRFSIYSKTEDDLYYCSYCTDNKGFSHKTRLVEHMHTSHADAFPFSCETCKQGFLEKSFLRVHRLKAHGIYDENEAIESSEARRNDILLAISGKLGFSNKVQLSEEYVEDADNTVDAEGSQAVVDAEMVDSTNESEEVNVEATSSLVIEVAGGASTYRYVIEAADTLGEDGSITVAQDIAQLLLAAEQTIQQDGTSEEGVQEMPVHKISLMLDENNQLVVDETAVTQQASAEPMDDVQEGEATVQEQGDNSSSQLQVVHEDYFTVSTTPDEGESHGVDLVQLVATETVTSNSDDIP